VAGLGIFLPILIVSYILVRKEGYQLNDELWRERLRFKKMSRSDWKNSLAGLLSIAVLSFLIIKLVEIIYGSIEFQPSFLLFEPLTKGRYFILAAWLPYWILNIMGEEIFWRGVILPKQEIVFGKYTWLVHGILWGIFHLSFGWQLLLTLAPTLLILPYIVQKQKNSWIGVIIHSGINGPSFIAISFGLF
jgi:membrane protease YdiL (CAAX protease family)